MSPTLRLDPADEATHENTGESNFNESMYFKRAGASELPLADREFQR